MPFMIFKQIPNAALMNNHTIKLKCLSIMISLYDFNEITLG